MLTNAANTALILLFPASTITTVTYYLLAFGRWRKGPRASIRTTSCRPVEHCI
jgi:hypothetical protein